MQATTCNKTGMAPLADKNELTLYNLSCYSECFLWRVFRKSMSGWLNTLTVNSI